MGRMVTASLRLVMGIFRHRLEGSRRSREDEMRGDVVEGEAEPSSLRCVRVIATLADQGQTNTTIISPLNLNT